MDNSVLYRDQELFRRIADGDGAAFTDFFNVYSVKLAIYTARLLHSDLWAQEIVQDTFMKLWASRETIGEIEYPAAFIYRMTANRIKDHLRHRAQEVKLQYYLEQQSGAASGSIVQEQLDYRISRQVYAEAVRSLPPQRGLIYRLRHEEGLDYDAIARQLGLSPNTVRNHLHLALQQIRMHLIEHGVTLLLLFFFQ